MGISIIVNILLSIIIIYIFHQSLEYLKNTFSIKKTKDLVKSQTQKYKQILEEIQHYEKSLDIVVKNHNNQIDMEDELQNFIETI
jgi:hypothetical protein